MALSVVAVVFILAAGTSIIRVNASEALVNRGAFIYNSTTDATSASASVAAALRIFPSDRAYRAAVELGLLELQILSATADTSTDAVKQQLQDTLQKTIAHGLEAVSINSYDYQNWLELASLYSELAGASVQGAYEAAQEAYARAADENPNNPLPFMGLAQLERLQGNASSSLAYLAKAVQIKPDFAAAYYLASQIYASQGEMASAASSAALAAQYAPNDPQAWYNLGIIQYASDNDATAQLALRQSLSLNPKFANAMYVLGLSYYRQGDTDMAISTLEALDQLDPAQPAVQQLLENLRSDVPFSEAAQNDGT
ncbi:MAG: tetratricopeptide repeat protein [Patescibacteria group bacterium]|nr:tetratricopeptide repeat protein [Patescibacteria group bacterium]